MINGQKIVDRSGAIVKLSLKVAHSDYSKNQEKQEHDNCDIQNVWDRIKQSSYCNFQLLIARY
jgi:hypothetical protein